MQILIDISKDKYNAIVNMYDTFPAEMRRWGLEAIKNGIPLPQGHGRLIDADETLKAMDTWDKFGYTETGHLVRNPGDDYVPYVRYEDMIKAINGMPTIVEANKENTND